MTRKFFRNRRGSIKGKLTLLFLAIALVPLVCLGLISYLTASDGLRQQAANQLLSSNALKKSTISHYFTTLEQHIVSLARDTTMQEALQEFTRAFTGYRGELKLDDARIEQLRKELGNYYTHDFADAYRSKNEGDSVESERFLNQQGDDTIALQSSYISRNSNALGSKHLLDAADDNSSYSKVHNRLHPKMRDLIAGFGYYDLFLVDAASGNVVYTVFK